LFAHVETVARIENAEAQLLRDCAEAIAQSRPDAGVMITEFGGGMATYTGPDSPLNKIAGLGFDGQLDEAELAAIEAALQRRGEAVRVELSSLAEPAIGAALTRRGYVLRGFENILGRQLPIEASATGAGIEIVANDDEDFAAWLDVIVTGFATPDTQGQGPAESVPREVLEQIIGDMASARGFVRYLAHLGGRAAGAGSMRICAGVAQLCGAATLPDLRRRGVQTALLNRRLQIASDAGCEVAVITTQPGSKSQENAQRQGFELLYVRAVLMRQ